MKTAIYPGSFDPVTLGHMDVIERAARCFDRVVVCVMVNSQKDHHLFTVEQRVRMVRAAVAAWPNVEAASWDGLLADFAKSIQADILVKGIRNSSDLDMEYQMALINKTICPTLETVLFPASADFIHFSSTMAREMIRYHQPLEKYVPASVMEELKGR